MYNCISVTQNNLIFDFNDLHVDIKVACTSGQFFEKNYEAVPHIFFTNKLLSDWSKAYIKHIIS